MIKLRVNIPDNCDGVIDEISALAQRVGGNIVVSSGKRTGKEQLKSELRRSLNEAFDMVEGKVPRKTLKEILNR